MAELAKVLGEQTGEKTYNLVRLDVNISGKIEWNCYTPSAGWNEGKTWQEASSKTASRAQIAAKLRDQAADLLAKAAALEGGQ